MWDYPRPPRVEPSDELVEIVYHGERVARSRRAMRVLETSHPPTYYLPSDDFADGVLQPALGASWCEWKGAAAYFDIVCGAARSHQAAWAYEAPTPGFAAVAGMIAVMPAAVDCCFVDGELVTPQEGGFYGGWITSRVVGPFKGGPGTEGW